MPARKSKTTPILIVLLLVMFVNSISYGTLVPLLYPYAIRFDITPFGLSVLFASFSLFQFFATPIIGRMSDRYGRKPLLLISLFGTGVSLALFASASTAMMLYFSRILDGITGGNNSVASAIVTDISKPADRAKTFGMLGAAQGLGFVLGPALGGVLSMYSLTAPFWLASGVAFISTLIGIFLLPETLKKKSVKTAKRESFFDMGKFRKALSLPIIGPVLMVSFLVSLAHNVFVLGFQAFSVDTLMLNATQIGIVFTMVGVMIAFMQAVGIRLILKVIKSEKKVLTIFLSLLTLVLLPTGYVTSLPVFIVLSLLYAFSFSPTIPVFGSVLSRNSKAEDQGGIMGIQQAIFAMGQIIGPLIAGVAISFSSSSVFIVGSVLFFISLLLSIRMPELSKAKANL